MPKTDVLSIRSVVATALTGRIGNYVYSNGSTRTALRVENGTQAVDANGKPLPLPNKVTGLEVVIEPYTNPVPLLYFGSRGGMDDRYRITLKQHDPTLSVAADFTTLYKALVLLGTPMQAGPLQPRGSALNHVEQQVLFVTYQRF